jgi:hypothetical protein
MRTAKDATRKPHTDLLGRMLEYSHPETKYKMPLEQVKMNVSSFLVVGKQPNIAVSQIVQILLLLLSHGRCTFFLNTLVFTSTFAV